MDKDEDYDEEEMHPDCAAMGCDIRPHDIECRRCGAEVSRDEDEEES